MQWVYGRQATGYLKAILVFRDWFDMHLLKFPKGSYIPPHTDPVVEYKHYRLNLVLKNAVGGDFQCDNTLFQIRRRLYFFRPDMEEHAVSKVEDGTRYVLSLGFRKKDNT